MMNDWLMIIFQVLAPIGIGGVIWVNMKINGLIKQQAVTDKSVNDLATVAAATADIPGRVIKLETTIPFMIDAQKRIEDLVKTVQGSTQRIEVSVAKITPNTTT